MKKYSTKYYGLMFGLIVSLSGMPGLPVHSGDRSAIRKEVRADRRFVNQDFDKAMTLYEKAIAEAATQQLQASLHAKSARLYYILRRYPEAIQHFDNAMKLQKTSLTAEDVCDFMDALRFTGQSKRAEVVCLSYTYQSVYSRNQNFNNSLEALSMRHTPLFEVEYEVSIEKNNSTSAAEYWVGLLEGQVCFARSDNRFNDPGKRFFYDTKLYPMVGSTKNSVDYIYKKMDGPFAMFNNGYKATAVIGNKYKREIGMASGRINPYTSQLVISGGKRKDQDINFMRLFPQETEYSYCHPFLFDDDRILLFASDAPGGYGGFDLYMVRWNHRMGLWEDPVNLGPEINTAGDEMYPSYYDGKLYFASNGQIGYGGYDLYSYEYDTEDEKWIPGSLVHLPAPINSIFNDYCLLPIDEVGGYFVSDRNLATGDDIYTYHRVEKEAGVITPFFGMSEQNALMGGQAILMEIPQKQRDNSVTNISFPVETSSQRRPVLTLYFDFNRTDLTSNALKQLEHFLNENRGHELRRLRIYGYADDLKKEGGNELISLKRSETVATYLRRWLDIPMEVKGYGYMPLDNSQDKKVPQLLPNSIRSLNPELPPIPPARSSVKRGQTNALRRVDIYIND